MVPSQPGVEFEALRYEANGDKQVVRKDLHRVIGKNGYLSPGLTKEEIFIVTCKDVLWGEGTPVSSHNLTEASHFNGEIKDARPYNYGTRRCGVHFEHVRKPVAVKKENLRIVFELPN